MTATTADDDELRTLESAAPVARDGTAIPLLDHAELIASGETEGIQWCVLRAPIWGAANGYLRVGPEHPLMEGDEGQADGFADIPGGITYRHSDGWIGFDTCHGGDVWPGMPDAMKSLYDDFPMHKREWTDAKVVEAVVRAAGQIADADRKRAHD